MVGRHPREAQGSFLTPKDLSRLSDRKLVRKNLH